MSAGLTVVELAKVLDPAVSVDQVSFLVRALRLRPVGYRRNGQPGRPLPTYDARVMFEAHAALGPLLFGKDADQAVPELRDVELADAGGTVTPRRVIPW